MQGLLYSLYNRKTFGAPATVGGVGSGIEALLQKVFIHWLIEGTITYAMIVGFDDTGRYPIQVEWIGKPRGVNIPTFYYHRELKYYRGA
jgi:hypothetical protein